MSGPFDLPPLPILAAYVLPRGKRRDLRAVVDYALGLNADFARAMAAGGAAYQSTAARAQSEAASLFAEDAPGANTALRDVLRRHGVPRARVLSLVDGWNLLYVRQRHRDWTQLEGILRQTGGPMALIVGAILGADVTLHRDAFSALGRAIAFCELLRRLPSGLDHGRLYFPEDDIERFRARVQDIADRRATPQVNDLVWFELKRAREMLEAADGALAALPDDGSRRFVAILLAWQRELLSRVEKNPFGIDGRPVELSRWESARLAMTAGRGPA